MKIFILIILIIKCLNCENLIEIVGLGGVGSDNGNGSDDDGILSVISMQPNDLENNIYVLNEKFTFSNGYYHGWILPSNEKLQLDFTLYSNDNFIDNLNKMHTVYMYFTTESDHCDNYHQNQHIPLNVLNKTDDNLYTAQIQISLAYSETPYYICLQKYNQADPSQRTFKHQGTDYWLSIITTKDTIPLWLRIVVFTFLLLLSGLFSGLNLGLMSLDLNELEILKKIGTVAERDYAKKIYPLRKRGNFLLCTILLGNVLVNSISTLLLGDLLSGIYAAFGSTILIVLFGEIIPQAACSKHGLAVGAHTRFITYFFMFITSPVSFPLGKILDLALGKEIAATYNREKIRELMRNVKDLEAKEFKMIAGALDFSKRFVREIMTPIQDVYMLDIESRLDFATIADITQKGYSRIPVYETSRDNVVGLLHVKDFTLLDPDDNMPVNAMLEFYNHKVTYCYMDDKLDEMFEKFRQGSTHLAFVMEPVQDEDRDPYLKCVGIVTLEDILEELVQFEIYDEFDDKKDIERENENEKAKLMLENETRSSNGDSLKSESKMKRRTSSTSSGSSAFVSDSNKKSLSPPKIKLTKSNDNILQTQNSKSGSTDKPNYNQTHELTFFIQQQKDSNNQNALISPQLRLASFQFLSSSVAPFKNEFLTKNVLELIFKRDVFKESACIDKNTPEYLYQYGKPCNYFVLILSGEATIEVGAEKLEFVTGQFSYFGVNALLNENSSQSVKELLDDMPRHKAYIPDFSLRVDTKSFILNWNEIYG